MNITPGDKISAPRQYSHETIAVILLQIELVSDDHPYVIINQARWCCTPYG